MSIQSNGGSEIRRSNSTDGESCHEYNNNNNTTWIKILGGRSQFPLPSTEGAGMKIDRATIPTFNNNNNNSNNNSSSGSTIFTITEWNKFCDTINNIALQHYNNTISAHSSSTISKLLILPIIAISILSIILVIFARPVYLGIGIFVCMMVVCIGICLYDRYWRVRFVYDDAVKRLCHVVEWLNHGDDQQQLQQQEQEGDDCGGGLMERCGVRLSVVLTGPISTDGDDANNNDATSDVEGPNNDEDNDKWNYWTGGRNNVTNLYIEFKRISPPRPSQHYERRESNGSSNGNLQRGRAGKNKRQQLQQQRKATDMIYNEEDQSFSC